MSKKKSPQVPDRAATSLIQSPSLSPPPAPALAPRHDSSGFASLAGIAALILAALQVIPAYVPRDLWTYVIIGICLLGLGVYLFAKLRMSPSPDRARYFAIFSLLFAVACFSGYQIFSLRQQAATLRGNVAELTKRLTKETGSKPLQDYLAAVVKEGDERWNGEFESRYARPTLYLLNNDDTTRNTSPIELQEKLLLWRTGTAGIGPEFRGIAGLVGDMSMEERARAGLFNEDGKPLDAEKIAKGFINHVDRPLADSDLLNKRHADPRSPGAKDDMPDRILVLADPAAGKSTMLERLDLIQARRARGSASEAVPVRISLSGLQHPTKDTIVSRIRERLGDAADDAFKDRTLIVLADALDEASDPIAAARAIAEFIKEYQAEDNWKVARIIVTSRLRNYARMVHESDAALWKHKFSTVILYGLDQISIEKQILTRSNAGARHRLFLKLAESPSRAAWLQFLRLPLNYELVAEVLAESDSNLLPEGQAQLIDKFVARRFAQKNISPADTAHCRDLLAVVAANRIAAGVNNRSKAFGIADFRRPGEPEPAFHLINPSIDRMLATGLIEERTPGQYRFFHQNILDFFVAKGLNDISVIDPKLEDWREIILFRSAMPGGEQLLHHIEKCKADGSKIDDKLMEEVRRIVAGAANSRR